MKIISTRGTVMPASPIRRLAPYANQAVAEGKHLYYMNIGQPDIKTPESFVDAVKNMDMSIVAYGPSAGMMALRQKFSEA